MNPRQSRFVALYADPSGSTFGVAVRAYAEAYPGVKRSTAYANGPRLLKDAEIRSAISEAMERHGVSTEVCLAALAKVVRGEYESRSVVRTVAGDTETESTPTAADMVQAIKVVMRVDRQA